jgi:GDPmannose 4,6-dehydratase
MVKILQQDKPEDFVIGTGETHPVQEFVDKAFSYVDLDPEEYVKIDPRYFRPTETEKLVADPQKARKKLDWNPRIKFEELVRIMVDADMRKTGLKPVGEGDKILKKKFSSKWWKTD